MYKGSVDVQELDLQSLMHTASELEIRGLAYEARDNAAQMLNVNLEYPSYSQASVVSAASTASAASVAAAAAAATQAYPQARSSTDMERLKQVSCCFSIMSICKLHREVRICYKYACCSKLHMRSFYLKINTNIINRKTVILEKPY